MNTIDPHASDLLFPLSAFPNTDQAHGLHAAILEAEELPEPYRTLLAHDRDMTGTLETYAGQAMTLHVLAKTIEGDALYRQVVLAGACDKRPKEFGAIRIDLSCFDQDTRAVVASCAVPLGRVLREHHVAYVSNPSAFLRVTPDEKIRQALGGVDGPLFGRKNELTTPDGRVFANIVEILPPLTEHKGDA